MVKSKLQEMQERRRSRRVVTDAEKALLVDEHEPKIRSNWYFLWIIKWEIGWLLLGMLGGAIAGTMPVIFYLILGGIIDQLSTASEALPSTSRFVNRVTALRRLAFFETHVIEAAQYMAIAAGCTWAGALLLHFCMNLAQGRIENRLKRAYFDSLLDQEIAFFDVKKTGQLLAELSDMDAITDAVTIKLGEFSRLMIQVLLGLALAIYNGWKMALVMLSVSPLMLIALGSAGIMVKFFQRLTSRLTNEANGMANEVISSVRTVRSMAGEEKEVRRFYDKLVEAHPFYLLKALILGVNIGLSTCLIWATISLSFWYGGRLNRAREMTVGELFKVVGYVLLCVMGMALVLQIIPDFARASTSITNLLKVIQRKPVLKPMGGITPNQIVGKLEFKNVHFTYPSRKNIPVLIDFSLVIEPGQTVALVGASGSGKSTIVGLIEKFYAPDYGEILLDGVNLEDIDPRWIHRNVGIVTQEPTLFACSIKDNIKYAIIDENGGRPVTDEEVIEAAKAANCHDFISALPDGYETQIGERGVSLSGGQKQRIAIARAMIQNPSLLLLDEATSALDTQSEAVVQEALNRLMKGRTSIVIAHRLSTIVDSDVIVAMSQGVIVEKGRHEELLKIPDGYYAKLAAKQMSFGRKRKTVLVAKQSTSTSL